MKFNFSENLYPVEFYRRPFLSDTLTLTDINLYPDRYSENVKKKLSKILKIDTREIHITSGSLSGIDNTLRYIKNKRLGYITPTFWGYENCATRNQYQIEIIEYSNKNILEKYSSLAERCDTIIICNPNNPTLHELFLEDIEYLLFTYSKVTFIIDETLLMFREDYLNISTLNLISKHKNLYVIGSFSKVGGIPGLRVGFIISHENNVRPLMKSTVPYEVGTLQQKIIIEYLDADYFPLTKDKTDLISDNFSYFIDKLKNKKNYIIKIYQRNTIFILIKLKEKIELNRLIEYLETNNLIIRNISDAYSDVEGNWIRISCSTKENLSLLAFYINQYFEEINIDTKKLNR